MSKHGTISLSVMELSLVQWLHFKLCYFWFKVESVQDLNSCNWIVKIVLPLLHSTPGWIWVSQKFDGSPGTWASTAMWVDAPGHGYHHAMASAADVCCPTTVSSLKFYLLQIFLNWTPLGLPCSVTSWQTGHPHLPHIMLRGCSQSHPPSSHHISSHCPDIAHIHTQNFSTRLLESPPNSWLANQGPFCLGCLKIWGILMLPQESSECRETSSQVTSSYWTPFSYPFFLLGQLWGQAWPFPVGQMLLLGFGGRGTQSFNAFII